MKPTGSLASYAMRPKGRPERTSATASRRLPSAARTPFDVQYLRRAAPSAFRRRGKTSQQLAVIALLRMSNSKSGIRTGVTGRIRMRSRVPPVMSSSAGLEHMHRRAPSSVREVTVRPTFIDDFSTCCVISRRLDGGTVKRAHIHFVGGTTVIRRSIFVALTTLALLTLAERPTSDRSAADAATGITFSVPVQVDPQRFVTEPG